jgi:hypothetical protein
MRVISGFVAVAMLAALAQPALAVCVYRGLATMCYDEPKGFLYEKDAGGSENADRPTDVPTDLKTIVLRPNGSGDAAWVMTPGSSDGAATARSLNVAAPACEPGLSC